MSDSEMFLIDYVLCIHEIELHAFFGLIAAYFNYKIILVFNWCLSARIFIV